MAKQVEDIFVRLNIQNAEALSSLRSSFRELSKVIAPANVNLEALRQEVLAFGNTNARSEQLIKGQIEALKSLQKQAGYTTETYRELGNDIGSLDAELRGSTSEIDKQREALVKAATASKANAEALRTSISALERLQQQTRGGSAAYEQLGRDIAGFRTQLDTATTASRTHVNALTQILGVRPEAVLKQWRAYQVALNDSSLSAEKLAVAQRRLNQLSGAPRILERQAINAQAEIVADPEYQRRFGIGGQSLPELANVLAQFPQRLRELRADLNSTIITSDQFIATLVEIARVENQAAQATVGLGQALVRSIQAGETPTTINTITNALNTLRSEVNNIDQSTIDGARQFAQYNNQIVALEAQLNKLTTSYRNVANAATDAAAAQRASATTRNLTNLYLNNAATVASTTAYQSIVNAGLAPGVPLLPPVGGTSSTGRGMARSLVPGRTESTTRPAPAGGTVDVLRRRSLEGFFNLPDVQAGSAAVANLRQNLADLSASTIKASRPLKEIYIDINKVGQASRGSVDELQLQKRLFEELRNAVNPLSPAFRRAGDDIDVLNGKIERLQGRAKRKGFTGIGAAQTAGAVISGGIFGGPEGLLGGVLGAAGGFLAGGGPGALGGAFAGSAIGAQVGMFRQQIAGAATYAAEISKLRIALQDSVGSFEDYRTALQAIESISSRFNVPIKDATEQFTKLSAAVVGSGGTIQEAQTAFEGLTAAVIATGGGTEDVNGALRAAQQVFSKGKVTAEELRNQIGERLAGAFAKFAESANKSTGELDTALKRGEVGIADFNKFLQYLRNESAKTAETISQSPAQAGARLELALQDLQKTIGDALSPAGAAFQDFATRAVKALDSIIDRAIKLKAINPGSNYFLDSALLGKGATPNRQSIVDQINTAQAEYKSQGATANGIINSIIKFGGGGIFTPAMGVSADLLFPSKDAIKQRIETLKAALADYDKAVKTSSDNRKNQRQKEESEEVKRLKEQGGKSLLQAITQREEQLFDTRKQYEEQIAEIRKAAIEQARDLERQFNEDRLQAERETANTLRNTAAVRQDITFLQRKIAGEDPRLVDFEQQIAEIERNTETAKITAAQKAADAERKQKQTIADFELKTAQSLNKANETYAKRIGEIQVNYAKTVANIMDDVTGRAASRLTASLRLVDVQAKLSDPAGLRAAAGIPQTDIAQAGMDTQRYEAAILRLSFIYSRLERERDALIKQLQGSINAPTVKYSVPSPQTAAPIFTAPQFVTNAAAGADAARQAQRSAEETNALTEEQRDKLKLVQDIINNTATEVGRINTDLELQILIQRNGINPELTTALNKYNDIYQKGIQQLALTKLGAAETTANTNRLTDNYNVLVKTTKEYYKQLDAMKRMQDLRIGTGFQEGINQYVESIGTLRKATTDLTINGIKGVEDAIFSLVTTGSANFKQFALDIIQQTTRIIIQQFILRNILSGIRSIFGFDDGGGGGGAYNIGLASASAKGNVFASNGIQPFAMGGIVTQPTLFKYANGGIPGTGLMGEAGPEAIVPLRRGRDGRLGVAGGGGNYNVTVNVDAKGTNAEGNSNRGEQLGRVISQAVQAELIKQRRPGGLLT